MFKNFCNKLKQFRTSFAVTHATAYLIFMIENYANQKLADDDSVEAALRLLIMLASFTTVKLSVTAYQNCQDYAETSKIHHVVFDAPETNADGQALAQNVDSRYHELINGESPNSDAIASLFHSRSPEPQETTTNISLCARLRQFLSEFHTGFALSAGSASFLYALLPVLGVHGSREIEPLSMISTGGTIVGIVNAIHGQCQIPKEETPLRSNFSSTI